MNRRSFILNTVGLATASRFLRSHPYTSAIPRFVDDQPPASIDLGSEVTLVDYRRHPGLWPAMIGDLRNDSDMMIDAPTVSVTYTTLNGEPGFSWLSPTIPIIRPRGRIPVFGSLPDTTISPELREGVSFSLCTEAMPGKFSEIESVYDLRVVPESTVSELDYMRIRGTVENHGGRVDQTIHLFGIVRSTDDRILGMMPVRNIPALSSGKSQFFGLEHSRQIQIKSRIDPFLLVDGLDYNIEVLAGTQRVAISQGCAFGFPWE